jgi:hypothetical protein
MKTRLPRITRLVAKRGEYACSKLKVFYVLANPSFYRLRYGWFTNRQLAILAGVPVNTVSRQMPRWERFEYVTRRLTEGTYSPVWEYKISNKAERWLTLAGRDLPRYRDFIQQLMAWKIFLETNPDLVNDLMAMPYKDFEMTLNSEVKRSNREET